MRNLILLLVGIVAGSLLTVFAVQHHLIKAQLFSTDPVSALQIDTHGWLVFRNTQYGIQFKIPPSYEVVTQDDDVLIHRKAPSGNTLLGSVVLTKERGGLQRKINESMEQAGWKVEDRALYALQGPYVSTDDSDPNLVTSTYLFVRDFPKELNDNTIIRAVITERLDDPQFRKAKMAKKDGSLESLTQAEQILSTFRFLSYDELYGPQGYDAH